MPGLTDMYFVIAFIDVKYVASQLSIPAYLFENDWSVAGLNQCESVILKVLKKKSKITIMYEFGPRHTEFCKYRNSVITEWTTVVLDLPAVKHMPLDLTSIIFVEKHHVYKLT